MLRFLSVFYINLCPSHFILPWPRAIQFAACLAHLGHRVLCVEAFRFSPLQLCPQRLHRAAFGAPCFEAVSLCESVRCGVFLSLLQM